MNRYLKKTLGILSSGGFLLILTAGWVIYYTTIAIWSKEAFISFILGLENTLPVQALNTLFLLSLVMNIIRVVKDISSVRRWLAAVWLVLPVGVFIFLLGFSLNAMLRQEGTIVVGEGDTISPPWDERQHTVTRIDPGLRDELLGGDDSTLFEYEPMMVLRTSSGEVEVKSFPPSKIGPTYYHILDFGLAPGVRLSDGGNVLIDSHSVLRLLPPGNSDNFILEPSPYRVELRLSPTRVIRKGDKEAPVYSLRDVRYHATVYRGQDIVFEGLSSDGISFDDLTLELPPHIFWARVEAAQRPGYIPMVTGLLAMGAGIPLWILYIVVRLTMRRPEETEAEIESYAG